MHPDAKRDYYLERIIEDKDKIVSRWLEGEWLDYADDDNSSWNIDAFKEETYL